MRPIVLLILALAACSQAAKQPAQDARAVSSDKFQIADCNLEDEACMANQGIRKLTEAEMAATVGCGPDC